MMIVARSRPQDMTWGLSLAVARWGPTRAMLIRQPTFGLT